MQGSLLWDHREEVIDRQWSLIRIQSHKDLVTFLGNH